MIDNFFNSISSQEIRENCFKLIGDDWMLITAGKPGAFNTMTASWGQMGVLWNLPVAVCYIRPQRYTYGFANDSEYYSLCFFEEKYRSALRFCGSKSGRDYDKVKETGLHPLETNLGNVIFREAWLALECRKLYADDLKEKQFVDSRLVAGNYPKKDFHRFYIGEVVHVFQHKDYKTTIP